MARRRKSIIDIRRQLARIENLAGGVYVDENGEYKTRNPRMQTRYDKALGNAIVYEGNIMRQRSYKNTAKKSNDAFWRDDNEAARRYSIEGNNRKYSRNTYMGLSNG